MSIDWGFSLSVVLVGLVVVFSVLMLLVALCWIIGRFFKMAANRKKNSSEKPKPTPVEVKKPEPAKAVAAPKVQSGISGEVIAAISAAVAMMSDETGSVLKIKSVKRSKGARSVWNSAGVLENTRPF